MTGKCNR